MNLSAVLEADDAPLAIRLFGPFDARVHGQPLPRLRSRKGAWLLALLALRAGRTVQRSWLAGTLWPDSEEGDALYSLRRSLTDLRAALGSEAVRIEAPTPQTLRFNAEGCWIDALAFDEGLGARDDEQLAAIVDLYRGPLLEGCSEEWCLPERRAREEALLSALERLAESARRRRDGTARVHFLRRLLAVDAYRESAVGDLMEAHAERGDFAAATRAFLDFRKALKRELGSEPSADLLRRFEEAQRLSRSEIPPSGRSVPPSDGRRPPEPLTPLVGRETEVSAVAALFGEHRLVTLTGPGGIGKTRLAIGVAARLKEQSVRCLFADLTTVDSPRALPRVLMAAQGAWNAQREPDAGDLARAFSSVDALLIVDNCEQWVDGLAPLLAEILRSAPKLRVLATSRHALQLSGERPFQVPALAVGEGDPHAVRMFVHYARSVDSSFRSGPENEATLLAICRRLEGIPLAIELAAARVSLLSPEQILSRLDDRLTLLEGGSRDAPERHRTLRAALSWSYDLLSTTERRLFRRLSLLIGSWDLETAIALGGGEIEGQLNALIGKSLVTGENRGTARRFQMLETIKEYGLERLEEFGEKPDAQRALVSWAVAFAEDAARQMRTPAQGEALRRLEHSYPNLRTALEACGADENIRQRLSAALWRFWDLHGLWSEGIRALDTAQRARSDTPVAAEALLGLGVLRRRVGDLSGSEAALSRSLALWRKLENAYGVAATSHELGLIALMRGALDQADTLYRQSWDLAEREADDVHLAALANDRGELARLQGHLDEAEGLFARCLDLSRRLCDHRGMAGALASLGNLAAERGEFDEALLWGSQSLELLTALGDRAGRALVLNNLGFAHVGLRDPGKAEPLFHESAEIRQKLGDVSGLAHSFAGLSATASLRVLRAKQTAARITPKATPIKTVHPTPTRADARLLVR